MNNLNDFEKHIKNSFEEYSEEPSEKVWKNIQSKIEVKKSSKRLMVYWLAAASITLLAFVSSLFETTTQKPDFHKIASTKQNQQYKTIDKISISENIKKDYSQKSLSNKTSKQNITILDSANNDIKETPTYSISKPVDNSTYIENLLKNKGITLASNNPVSKELIVPKVKRLYFPNISRIKGKWSFGVLMASNYTESSSIDNGGNIETSATPSRTELLAGIQNSPNPESVQNIPSYKAGMSIEYDFGNKISIESGLAFSRMGQKYNNTEVSMNDMAENVYPTNIGKVVGSQSQLETTYGNNSNISSNKLTQTLDFIEIPLLVKYTIFEYKFKVQLQTGISNNFLIRNEAEITNKLSSDKSETDDMKFYNLAGNIGFGVQYPINSFINLTFGPSFKYFFNSMSNNSNINYKPYQICFQAGIKFSTP